MLGCPNCKAVVTENQMFCRTCGYRFDAEFQFSLKGLGIPAGQRIPIGSPKPASSRNQHQSHLLPIIGLVIAAFVTTVSVAPLSFVDNCKKIGISSSIFGKERSYIGVYLADSSTGYGAVIDEITDMGPAEQAGLASGDTILEVNSRPIADPNDLVAFLKSVPPGTDISVKVMRDHAEFYTSLTTVRRGDLHFRPSPLQGFLGVASLDQVDIETTQIPHSCDIARSVIGSDRLISAEPEIENLNHIVETDSAVRIAKIIEGSAAHLGDLREGDLILAIDGNPTRNSSELGRCIRSRVPGQEVLVTVIRDGQLLQKHIHMGSR